MNRSRTRADDGEGAVSRVVVGLEEGSPPYPLDIALLPLLEQGPLGGCGPIWEVGLYRAPRHGLSWGDSPGSASPNARDPEPDNVAVSEPKLIPN